MSQKILFSVLVIISLLFIALYPGTYSVLQGTHTILNISSPANDVTCTSCHSKIAAEFNNSTYHTSLSCEDCHRNPNIQTVAYDNGTTVPGEEAHAAVKPRCLDCHSKTSITLANGSVVAVAKADAFGDAGYGSDYSAHKKFVQDALNFDIGVGENEACLSCHTDFKVQIKFTRPLYYDFTVDASWNVVVNSYGVDNTTTVFKDGSGSKHIWKPLNQIKCEDCHTDVWSAINHTESSLNGETPNSSHVIWYWQGTRPQPRQAPIHDISYIGTAYGNISDYCLSSCHNPTIASGAPPLELNETVHVARRLSCYSCHTNSYTFTVLDKTSGNPATPTWPNSDTGDMDNFDVNVFNIPLSIHADTCISCKRAGAPSSGDFRTYSEPNNTVYYNNNLV